MFNNQNSLLQPPGAMAGGAMLNGMPGVGGQMNALQNYHTLHQDWHDQRPQHTPGMDPGAWQQSIADWRGLMPDRHMGGPGMAGGMGGGPVMQGAPIPGYPAPGMPNTQFPLNPGVGSQLGVIGMTPATSPYGLPSY